MKKFNVSLLIALLALTISGCTSTSKKKPKKTSSVVSSSVLSTSKQGTSNQSSGGNPSSEAPVTSAQPTQSSDAPIVSSDTSVQPTSVAPTSITPPPTDDYTDCEIAHQNHDANGLYSALHAIKSDKKPGTYGDLWELYKEAYIRDDGYIFDYYSCISNFRPGKDQAGSYSKEGDVYNREHSVPKSWYNHQNPVTGTQSCDPFIVVPTDGFVNNMRSNYTFGVVGAVSKQSAQGFCKLGTGDSSWGYNDTVFEPDDSLKGDFARIVFYSIGRYNVSSWTSGDGSLNYSGSTSTNFGLTNYAVKLFSYWSNLDPVSDWERLVNNRVEAWNDGQYGWRNPFIDHPEYANTLFGNNSNYTPYSH